MRNAMPAITGLFFCLSVAVSAEAQWHVWTVKETRRVLRDEMPGDRRSVELAAARNEWESFQILMRSDGPVEGVRVEAGDLTGPQGNVLRAADARLFREHQLELTDGSYRNENFRPGWYPDPLIPFRHPLTQQALQGGRLVATPFTLPANQTHGFWVDLYVPRQTPPGLYQGHYRVSSATGDVVAIPVRCDVWGFELPLVPTFRTALGSPAERMRTYYQQRAKEGKEPSPTDWDTVEAQCAQLLSDHRINATPPINLAPTALADGVFRISREQVDLLRTFVDRYHVNAVCVPHPRVVIADPDAEQDKLRAWLAAWDRAAAELERPQVLLYTYLRDEPNDAEAYQYVQRWGRAIREARSVVKVLVVEQTLSQDPKWGDLNGAVDIWCPLFCLHDRQTAAQRLAQGEIVWTYTALCQGKQPSPWWQIDFPLLNYRVPAWIAWGDQISGLLYWGGMSHWRQVEDPWTDPKTLDRRDGKQQPLYNGEGTLVYPGRAVGYDGIAPSMRLKALRDAVEDYEYLAILARQGRTAAAETIVHPLAASWFQWETDPTAYESVRGKLAALILQPAPQRGL